MLEVHPSPSEALCDALQQLTSRTFHDLMHALMWRKSTPSDDSLSEEKILIDAIRTRIDVLDDDLVDLLAQRMSLVDQIGEVKNEWDWDHPDRTVEYCFVLNQKIWRLKKDWTTRLYLAMYHAIHQQRSNAVEKIIRDE